MSSRKVQSQVSNHPLRAMAHVLGLTLIAGATASASAQETQPNLIALGAISVPEFEGSEDKVAAPLLIGRLDLGTYGSLRLTGLSLQYNVLGDRSDWALGPVVSFRAARDAGVKDEVVQRLREVDAAAEFGVFVEYGLRDTLARGDRVAFGVEAKGGKGSQLSLTASYQGAKQGAFQFGVDGRATFANDKYMDTYFSIDADNSARSGLEPFTATSGIKSMSLGFTGSYDVTRDWTVMGRLGFSRLLGDAKDSPIVQVRGNPNAVSAGLALGYRF